MRGRNLTTHSTGARVSLPFMLDVPLLAVRRAWLIRVLGGRCSKQSSRGLAGLDPARIRRQHTYPTLGSSGSDSAACTPLRVYLHAGDDGKIAPSYYPQLGGAACK
jgi:hypothetical protein